MNIFSTLQGMKILLVDDDEWIRDSVCLLFEAEGCDLLALETAEEGLKALSQQNYDIIISGEMTLDSLSSQIGPRLAELLDLPQITYVKEYEIVDGKVKALRELESEEEVVEAPLPAVITVLREINEPRIPSLMNIMKAKKKPQTVWTLNDLGLSVEDVKAMSYVQILEVTAPKMTRKQIRIEADTIEEAAEKLAEAIRAEGLI